MKAIKMLNMANYLRNANQNQKEVASHTSYNSHNQNVYEK